MTFHYADWKAGVEPPKGFDVADCLEFGWTKEEVTAMMREAVCDELLPFSWADKDEPAQTAEISRAPQDVAVHSPSPIDAIANMPRVMDLPHGGEVGIAQHFAATLEHLCGGRVVRADGAFWAWSGTEWATLPDDSLRLALHNYNSATVQGKSPIKLGSRMIDGALRETGTILSDAEFFHDPTVGLNALSGVIRIDSRGAISTRSHDPEDRFRFTIPARFDLQGSIEPPEGSLLHKLLHGAFLGDPDAADKIALISEVLGSAAFGMATRLPQPKAFVFLGETASNGKSTIASLLECLLPHDAVSHIAPSAFEDERRIVNLAGKAANVADELSAGAVAGETFKAAVTGNTIEGRDLYRSAMTFTPRAIHVFTTNTLPRFNGGLDRGLQRRLVVVRFNRSIPEAEIVEDIAERIRTDELDLLLRFAVAGAQRLTLNRAYTLPASSKEALQDWLRLDPVTEWFEQNAAIVDAEPIGGWHRTSDLFKDFKSWAVDQGHAEKFLPIVSTFGQRLKAMPGVATRHRSNGTVVIGVSLLKSKDTEPPIEW